jgi:hypothetical protein
LIADSSRKDSSQVNLRLSVKRGTSSEQLTSRQSISYFGPLNTNGDGVSILGTTGSIKTYSFSSSILTNSTGTGSLRGDSLGGEISFGGESLRGEISFRGETSFLGDSFRGEGSLIGVI